MKVNGVKLKKRYFKCMYVRRHDVAPKAMVDMGNYKEYICSKCGLPVTRVVGFVAQSTREYCEYLKKLENKK